MNCLKSLTHKQDMDKHVCEVQKCSYKENKIDTQIPDELPHYMFKLTKFGSKEGTEEKTKAVKTDKAEAGNEEKILRPRYIIFDFETDQITGIHRVSHVEAAIIQVDEGQTHDYEKCFIERFSYNGYDAAERFGDWFFTTDHSNCTAIAHKGAGFDNKFVLKHVLARALEPDALI